MLDERPSTSTETGTFQPSLKKNAFARLVVGGVALVALQTSNIVIARALGRDGKGLASLLALVAAIAIMLTDFGLTTSGVYFVGRRKYRAQNVVGVYVTAGLVVGMVTALLIAAFSHPLAYLLFRGKYSSLIILLAVGVPPALLSRWLAGVLRGQEKIVSVSYVNVGESIIGLVVLAFALFILRIRESAIVWGSNATVIFSLLATLYLLKRQRLSLRPMFDKLLLRDSISYGLKGQIGQILQWINYRFDLFVVNALRGISEAGVYSVGAGVSILIWQIPNALSYALYSRISSVEHKRGNSITVRVARQSMLLSLLSAIILAPVGYYAIPLLFGVDFTPAITAMWLLLPGVVALSYYKILGVHMAGQGRPEYNSYAAGISAILTLVLDFMLIPKWGINGAAVASTIAYTITAAISIHWFVKITGMNDICRLFIPEMSDFTSWLHR